MSGSVTRFVLMQNMLEMLIILSICHIYMRVCMYVCMYMYAGVGSFSRCMYCTLYTCACLLLASVYVLVCVQLISCWLRSHISYSSVCVCLSWAQTQSKQELLAFMQTQQVDWLLYSVFFITFSNAYVCETAVTHAIFIHQHEGASGSRAHVFFWALK